MDILLVEDDKVDIMTVERAFRKAGIDDHLHVARDGQAALKKLRGNDALHQRRLVILLDLNMPGMDGFEFLRELRADPNLRATPVIVLTTSDDARDRRRAFDLQVSGYFVKPLGFDKFVDVMSTITHYWHLGEMP
jgi:CheY-like chemotaxis protein